MIKDSQKVVVLPKKIALQDKVSYICSCDRCLNRQQQTLLSNQQKLETIRIVEDVLLMTPLVNKNINLKLSSQQTNHGDLSFTEFLQEIEIGLENDRFVYTAVKSLEKFVIQFNKKYRHPYICELHDNTIKLLETLPETSSSDEYILELERFEQILQYISDQSTILSKIVSENFIEAKHIYALEQKMLKARSQLKSKAQKTMRLRYQDGDQSEFINTYNINPNIFRA